LVAKKIFRELAKGGGIACKSFPTVSQAQKRYTTTHDKPLISLARSERFEIARLLGGFRGQPAGDVQAVARTMSALSRFIAEFSDRISEIEINPLAVMGKGQGCIALDCVLIPNDLERKHLVELSR